MKNINIIIDEVYNNILLQLQQSELPIAIVKLIIDNISSKIEKQYYATLNSLAEQQEINLSNIQNENSNQD